jgi:hypothetical protein
LQVDQLGLELGELGIELFVAELLGLVRFALGPAIGLFLLSMFLGQALSP